MKTKVQISILLFFGILGVLSAQVPADSLEISVDTLPLDTVLLPLDTIPGSQDTTPTRENTLNMSLSQVTLSSDSIDAPIKYSARDSMEYDIANKKIYLYGGAEVSYTTMNLKAGFIEFNWETGIVTAEGRVDSIGRTVEIPEFTDGDQAFKAQRMRYNFETQKGIIYDVSTTQQNLYVIGSKSKFIRTDVAQGDSTVTQDIIYSQDAIFTTCNHPEPHYGIRSQRQKVIPGKLVIVGPSNLEIAGVPTPLWLPFGFFPVTEKRSKGLIFPRDYEYSRQWGYGIKDIAYYLPLNDYMDLTISGDIYLKGTWGLNALTNYRKRYKYTGSAGIGFSSRRTENDEGKIDFQESYYLRVSHNQDSRAHPTRRLGGSINIQTNGYQQINRNDAQSVLQGQLSSNFSYDQAFPGKPYRLSIGLNHSQNTRTRDITINFPSINFQTQTMYPFKRKQAIGQERWYEQIALRYQGEAKNRFMAKDSTLFQQQTLTNAQFGARHEVSLNTSFKPMKNYTGKNFILKTLKYFSVNPSINYEQVWNFKYDEVSARNTFDIIYDTLYNADSTEFMRVPIDTIFTLRDTTSQFGFKPVQQMTASVGVNTQLFGTLLFKKGWLRGVRHVIKPSASFNYSPDYNIESLGFRDLVVQEDVDLFDTIRYNIFNNNIYLPPSLSGRQMSISYSINNIFEAKYFSKRDSTEKRLKLFDNIYINGNYNFARDTLKWSQVSMSGTTRFFKGISTLSASAAFDPYATGDKGQRINRFYWNTDGKILRFVNANFRFTSGITVGKIRELLRGTQDEQIVETENRSGIDSNLEEEGPARAPAGQSKDKKVLGQQENLLDLLENFRINHNFVFEFREINGRDTALLSTHSLNLDGSIQLTPNWSIRVGNIGYDFISKRITYPDLGFIRNLHCWQLSFNWFPQRRAYSFSLYVRDNPLNFIKIPYQRNNADGRFQGF